MRWSCFQSSRLGGGVEKSKVPRTELIKQELYTGHIGDGKIFVYDITNVIRVRTGDEELMRIVEVFEKGFLQAIQTCVRHYSSQTSTARYLISDEGE